MKFASTHPMTLGAMLTAQADRFGMHPYISLGTGRWSYAEVETQAAAVAAGLRSLGLQAGDRLAVMLPNVPGFVMAVFAAAKAGLILVPISVRRHPTEVLARLVKTQAAAVITDRGTLANHHGGQEPAASRRLDLVLALRCSAPGLRHVIAIDGAAEGVIAWDELAAAAGELPYDAVRPEDPAAIVHTLGSAGEPRGAVLTHAALVRNAAAMAGILRCTPDDVFLGAVPFSNTFGFTANILTAAVAGAQIAALPVYHPGEALALISRARVTVHHGVPTMFAVELNHARFAREECGSLRTGFMAGAPCPPELVRRVRAEMGCQVLVAYGLTEAAPMVTSTRLDDGPVTSTQTVGRPIEGVALKVVGPQGDALPPGETGELCVRGYNVMAGYWNAPQATAEMLDAEGWLHTGDLAGIDEDGPVRILGRKDEVINRGGFKIYPGMVEMVLRSYPGVKEAAVVGVPDGIFGELPCACVVRLPGATVDADELLAFAKLHLADYAVPYRVLFFEALPRRDSGSVQRASLRERVRIRGRVWKFGKNVDTDAIIPARHCNTADPVELARHCMEDADADFVRKMRRGDVIVADSNFGCGSSREVAPISIKAAGVSAVIARSFARIFFRNAINIGLPILECPAAADTIAAGDEIEVEPATGTIRNLTRGECYQAAPFPDFLQHIIERGGLLAYVEDRLAQKSRLVEIKEEHA